MAGSVIGGIAETQEMLDLCGKHGITSMTHIAIVEQPGCKTADWMEKVSNDALFNQWLHKCFINLFCHLILMVFIRCVAENGDKIPGILSGS